MEGIGSDSFFRESVLCCSFFRLSFIICVDFSAAVPPAAGYSVVGFSDDGKADDGPAGGTGTGRSRMIYSLLLNFPA